MTTVRGVVKRVCVDVPSESTLEIAVGDKWVRVNLDGAWHAVLFDDDRVYCVEALVTRILEADRPVHVICECDPDGIKLVAYKTRFTTPGATPHTPRNVRPHDPAT